MIVECPGCQSRYDLTGRPPRSRGRCRCGTIFELPEPSDWARALGCPTCGANVAPTNHRCEYCDAALLVKACPRCFARVFHGAKHCDRCGADTLAPAEADPEGNATARTCPRCETPALVSQLVGDIVLDECPDCHGVYVDRAALERILSERQQARAEAILGASTPPPASSQPVQPEGPMYVRCPDCAKHMNRRSFATGSGVVIDVCLDHGTWFDAHELPRVVEFTMQGGLERAATREAARAREEARALRSEARALHRASGQQPAVGLAVGGGYHSQSFFGQLMRALSRRIDRG